MDTSRDIEQMNLQPRAGEAADEAVRARSGWWVLCVLFGVLVTLVAWVLLMPDPQGSLVAACVGFALSMAGLMVGRGCWRDVTVVSAVASGVLVLVHVIFYAALDIVMGML